MEVQKKVSARKLVVLYLLDAPDSQGNPHAPIRGTTRLQKLLFLLQDIHKDRLDPRIWMMDFAFVPEKFGPADLSLYQDLDFLELAGLITSGQEVEVSNEPPVDLLLQGTTGEPSPPEEQEEGELSFDYLMGTPLEILAPEQSTVERVYAITDKGRHFLERLDVITDPTQRRAVEGLSNACQDIKRKFGTMSLKQLLGFVYRNYEQMTTASTIKDRILRTT